ncbi:hypothetical protein GQ44DRAFT_680205 [Phaeosphaeriaceae sp. PMI808]|nr:hypothetical protein GQ44DRAFT_680205 [Phaeosphaeriaceae sp. PMI808]
MDQIKFEYLDRGDQRDVDPWAQLKSSCEKYEMYPGNIVGKTAPLQRINAYMERLQSEEKRLFSDEKAFVKVLDVNEKNRVFTSNCVSSLHGVQELLLPAFNLGQPDSTCRFFFIQAKNSRAPLSISSDMLKYIFSYYQIPPSFLDLIFSFGARENAMYNDFSALHKESRLFHKQRGLEIPKLGRSGHDVRISYNLRSVEYSPNQVPFEWSIRQTAVYHSFDIVTGKTWWINVKGNRLLENRIFEAEPMFDDSYADPSAWSLSASLKTHIVFAEWAGENWRSYINDLEEEVQRLTIRTLAAPIEQYSKSYSRSSTLIPSETSTKSTLPVGTNRIHLKEKPKALESRRSLPGEGIANHNTIPPPSARNRRVSLDWFTFSDIQDVQHIEEKIEEAIVVISFNKTTLEDLRRLYRSLFSENPTNRWMECVEDMDIFEMQLVEIEKDLNTQSVRSKSLLTKLQERKSLLHGILQFRNMEASESFAKKAQISSDSMETITIRMHEIAIKNRQEAVSMRIITLVTLFFLPGTFVATFMSTDVLRWTESRSVLEPQALITYISISLPLMVITFSTWYALYWYSNSRESRGPLLRSRKLQVV